MNRNELRNIFKGVVGVTVTPYDDDYEVDHGLMYELSQWWADSGIVKGRGIIKIGAAAGEGPMLRDEEWPALLRTAVQATGGKSTIMCGLHYKDTLRTIEDAKKAQDMGAVALQVCPPIFNDFAVDKLFISLNFLISSNASQKKTPKKFVAKISAGTNSPPVNEKKKLKKVFISQNTDTVTMPVAIINLTKFFNSTLRPTVFEISKAI